MAMRIDILTLFPEMFAPVLGSSILKRAGESNRVEYHLTDIRRFTTNKHGKGHAHLKVDVAPQPLAETVDVQVVVAATGDLVGGFATDTVEVPVKKITPTPEPEPEP
jgi:hypothetical protein